MASVPRGGTATRVTVDGWQQGWRLEGPVERVQLTYAPDRLYRIALGVGGDPAPAPGGGRRAAQSATRFRSPPLGSRSIHPWLMVTGGLLALGVMAGWWALACGAVGRGGGARRSGDVLTADLVSWASGMLVAAAALFYWQRPLGSADGWAGTLTAPQLLVAAALGVLLCCHRPAVSRTRGGSSDAWPAARRAGRGPRRPRG